MTRQILDTTAGAGDTGKAGGDKLNAMTQELYALTYAPRCRAHFLGDSKSQEPLEAMQWLQARDPRDVDLVWLDPTYEGVGGTNTGSGSTNMTNPTRMAGWKALISADVVAGYTVDVYLTGGTNDIASHTPETSLANVKRMYNEALASGARYFIAMGIDPRGQSSNPTTSLDDISFIVSFNAGLARMARELPRFKFVDTFPVLADFSQNAIVLLNSNGQAVGNTSNDGLHLSAYGVFRKQFALASLFYSLYGPRSRGMPVSLDDQQGVAARSRSTMLAGGVGRFLSDGGSTANITTHQTSSFTGSVPNGYGCGALLSGNMQVAFSMANCPAGANPNGAPIRALRVSISGTPAESGYLAMQPGGTAALTQGVDYRHTVNQYVVGASGFRRIFVPSTSAGSTEQAVSGFSTVASVYPGRSYDAPENAILGIPDGMYTTDQVFTAVASNPVNVTLTLSWSANVPLSGDFYLIGERLYPLLPSPAAS